MLKIWKIRLREPQLGVEIDTRELTGGEKAWSWVKKGVPIRLEIEQRTGLENSAPLWGRRDKKYKERKVVVCRSSGLCAD